MAQCQNCHTELTGPFCSNCGQSSEVERLKVGTLFNLAASHLFDLDSKIFRTFLDLISRPGEAIRDYILGKRKLNVNPVNYYLISGTLIILLTTWFPRNFIEIADNFSPDLSTMDPEKAAIVLQSQRELMQFVIDHFRLINMLIYLCLPLFLSVFFRYKKYGYSTVDYYVFILFCASQINFISAPLHIIGYYFDLFAWGCF